MSGARGVAEVYHAEWTSRVKSALTNAFRQTLAEKAPDPVARIGRLLTGVDGAILPVSQLPLVSQPSDAAYSSRWSAHINATTAQAWRQTFAARPADPVVHLGCVLLAASAAGDVVQRRHVAARLGVPVERWLAVEGPLAEEGISGADLIEFKEQGLKCVFWFIHADKLRAFEGTTPPKLQDIRREHPDWLKLHTVEFSEGIQGKYAQSHLVVSHRWEKPGAPDEMGVQFSAVKAHLLANSAIEWVWFDYWSMPQGDNKAAWEQIAFDVMLRNINLLYLFCGVLVLADLSYISRFWTQFEAFLSLRTVTKNGLEPTVLMLRRCVIKCIHNAPASFEDIIVDMWADVTAQEAHDSLAKPDVTVTNQSDKEVQLPKLLKLNKFAQEHAAHVPAAPAPQKAASAPRDKKLVVIIADYDYCFDALFRMAPAMGGVTVDEAMDINDLNRYTFGSYKPEEQAYISALEEWLKQQTVSCDVMLYSGSNRQSKKADLAVGLFKIQPRLPEFPNGKYPSMLMWIRDQTLNEGFVGLSLLDYERLASVPSAVLSGYSGKSWQLVPSLLEDRLTGSKEGTEWGRRDNVSAEGAVTKFGYIDVHKDKEETALEKPVEVKFDLFDTVTYHGKVPKKNKVEEECKQKLAIVRHQLESMATHVGDGAVTYSSIQVYYIDDRRELLDYVGPKIDVRGNTKLVGRLGSKARALLFSTVEFAWKYYQHRGERQTRPTVVHTTSAAGS